MTARGRILCVTSNFPRWAGDTTTPFVLHLVRDLQALGWTVEVLAPHAPGAARSETLDGVQVERFRYLRPDHLQTVCYQGGALINLRQRPLDKLKLPALVAAELGALWQRLRSQQYDLLHSHWILPQGFTGMLATRLRSVPHVITAHGGDVFALRGRLLTQFKRSALRAADAVTVNSSVTEQAVAAIAPGLERLERIPMGVSVHPPTSEGLALTERVRHRYRCADGPLLIFVGRIVDEKGVDDLLAAMALLRHQLPSVRALIIGDGQDRPAMERAAVTRGVDDLVTFTGWIDAQQVPAHLRAADIFVGPSRTSAQGWIEAQGLTFLEAMAAQVPVIATRRDGIVDAVIDGKTGLLVPERAPEAIAAAVLRLHQDKQLKAELVERGYCLANDHFSRAVSAERFSRLFEQVIAEGRR